MPDQTVPTPDPYAELAAEMRLVADDVEKLVGSGLAMPTFIQLSVQPGAHRGAEETEVAVDAWAIALLGRSGSVHKMSDGTYFYKADGVRGPISVQLYNSVSTEWALAAEHGAEIAKREAEIERLRAEVAELRSTEDPDRGRTTAVAEAKPDTLMVPHGEAHRTAAPDMQTRPLLPGVVVCALCGFEPDDPNHPKSCPGHPDYPSRATAPDTSCLAVLPSGVRCDEPIFWNPTMPAWWHEHTGYYGHTATGPAVPPNGGE